VDQTFQRLDADVSFAMAKLGERRRWFSARLPVDRVHVAHEEPLVPACAVGDPQITTAEGGTAWSCSYKRDLGAVWRPAWFCVEGGGANKEPPASPVAVNDVDVSAIG
jgi:hypothetical protein